MGTPEQNAALDIQKNKLRLFMNDTPELNRLIRTEEGTDAQYELAIELTIDNYNTVTPQTNYTTETFPSIFILLHGAAIELLHMAGIMQSRNRLNYSSGGVSIAVSDKAADYRAWIDLFVREYEKKVFEMKINKNIEAAYGGVHSEYYQSGRYGSSD